MSSDKQKHLTKAISAYALHRYLQQGFYLAGAMLLCLAGYVLMEGLTAGLWSSEEFQSKVTVTQIKCGDSLFWFLSKQALAERPQTAILIILGLAIGGLFSLLIGYLLRPKMAGRYDR